MPFHRAMPQKRTPMRRDQGAGRLVQLSPRDIMQVISTADTISVRTYVHVLVVWTSVDRRFCDQHDAYTLIDPSEKAVWLKRSYNQCTMLVSHLYACDAVATDKEVDRPVVGGEGGSNCVGMGEPFTGEVE